jgi:hypothetical protein
MAWRALSTHGSEGSARRDAVDKPVFYQESNAIALVAANPGGAVGGGTQIQLLQSDVCLLFIDAGGFASLLALDPVPGLKRVVMLGTSEQAGPSPYSERQLRRRV